MHRFPAIEERIAAVQRVDDLRWNLIMKNHAVIRLPAQHAGAALAELMSIQNRIQILDRPVRIIDLRRASRLVVRPYPVGFIAGASDNSPDLAMPAKTPQAKTPPRVETSRSKPSRMGTRT